jgi:hypothetical protein
VKAERLLALTRKARKKKREKKKEKGRNKTGLYKYTWFLTADTYGYLSGNNSDIWQSNPHT